MLNKHIEASIPACLSYLTSAIGLHFLSQGIFRLATHSCQRAAPAQTQLTLGNSQGAPSALTTPKPTPKTSGLQRGCYRGLHPEQTSQPTWKELSQAQSLQHMLAFPKCKRYTEKCQVFPLAGLPSPYRQPLTCEHVGQEGAGQNCSMLVTHMS